MRENFGKAAFKFATAYLRRRYGRQILIGIGVGAGVLAIGVYLAGRDAQEG